MYSSSARENAASATEKLTTEAQLGQDVEDLRLRFSKTQDLYREVCALLFFRYGITPTANRLYQLVRKGSMSAPAEALSQFWADLREKSRTRIEHPDLPEALCALGGEVMAQLWLAAQKAAAESLEVHRQEAALAVAQAQHEVQEAHRRHDEQQAQLRKMQEVVAAAQEQTVVLREHIATLEAGRQALANSLAEEKQENAVLHARLEEHRREFTTELDGLRTAMQQADERTRATEKRLLLDLDRERMASLKARKELDELHKQGQEAARRHHDELSKLNEQLLASQQQGRELEQRWTMQAGQLVRAQAEAESLRANHELQLAELATVQRELAAARAELKSSVQETAAPMVARRKRRAQTRDRAQGLNAFSSRANK